MNRPRRSKPAVGARPGTLAIREDAAAPKLRVIRYDGKHIEEQDLTTRDDFKSWIQAGSTVWIDVQGLGDAELLWTFSKQFNIHPLAIEDIAHVPQRPKSDEYEDQHLLIVRMVEMGADLDLKVEQVALVIGPGYVITFQEKHGDVLDPVRTRLREASGHIRTDGSDYLAYAIVDTIVDGYFPVLEELGELMEGMEDFALKGATEAVLTKINALRALLFSLRRSIWPLRDVLNSLTRDSHRFLAEDIRLYFRDTYDHSVQLVETLESYREVASGLTSTHLSVVSNRTNDVMKVLTIMASIFIPLTFIVGVYGMNFDHMPELHYRWGYFAVWGVMFVIGLALFGYFRRKGWIGRGKTGDRG